MCRKNLLEEMRRTGYLTRAPRFAGHWSGCDRTIDQRENVHETKNGRD
jgi:hypothetical protein